MASQKVTFTLDADTVARLRTAAERLHLPYSQVVREAIAEYGARIGRLSEAERSRHARCLRPAAAVGSRQARGRSGRGASRHQGRAPARRPEGGAPMIHLDTCVLVDALTGPRRSAPALRALIEQGERISFSALVLYEWLRGPRRPEELRVQEALFPGSEAALVRAAGGRAGIRAVPAGAPPSRARAGSRPSPRQPSCTTRRSGPSIRATSPTSRACGSSNPGARRPEARCSSAVLLVDRAPAHFAARYLIAPFSMTAFPSTFTVAPDTGSASPKSLAFVPPYAVSSPIPSVTAPAADQTRWPVSVGSVTSGLRPKVDVRRTHPSRRPTPRTGP